MRRVEQRLIALERRQVGAEGEVLAIVLAIGKPSEQVAREVAALERHLVATRQRAPVIILDR